MLQTVYDCALTADLCDTLYMLVVATALPWETDAARGGAAIAGRGRVRLVTSGVGPVRARDTAEELLDTSGDDEITAILSVGVAGGLTNGMPRPALTVPTEIQREWDGESQPPDAALTKRVSRVLNRANIRHHSVASITTPVVLYTAAEKQEAAQGGAEIVQMEDSEWAELSAEAGIPFTSLRVVMDALDDDLPTEVTDWGDRTPSASQLLLATARRPRLLRELIELGLQRRSALLSLERALTVLIPALAPD